MMARQSASQLSLPFWLLEEPHEYSKPDTRMDPGHDCSFRHKGTSWRKKPVPASNPWRQLACSVCHKTRGHNIVLKGKDGTTPVVCKECMGDLNKRLMRGLES